MAKPLLPDHLWHLIEPLLPEHPPHPKGGRPFFNDRKALTGIVFILRTGIPWEYLPLEMGCGCGMTCWRRLRDWTAAGVWPKVWLLLLEHLRFLGKLDFERFLIDSTHYRAVGGGAQTGPSPVDRRKLGSKTHLLTDGGGIPVTLRVTAANWNDNLETVTLIDQVPPIAGKVGRPRRRPRRLQGDGGYDDEDDREQLRRRGIQPLLGKRRREHGSKLGRFRWFVERTISWFKQFRRLRIRYERRPELTLAFWQLAAIFICHRIAFHRLC
jgi:transposase